MNINKKSSSGKTPEELKQIQSIRTAQQWIPIIDIDNAVVYRRDNTILGAIRVQPLNIDLLSDSESRRIVDALSEGLNGENENFQIFCIGRPVDLNNYLEWLQVKLKNENDFMRKRVLKNYIHEAAIIASSGDTIERRFYVIVTKPAGHKSESDLLNRLSDFAAKLSSAELVCTICKDDELMDLFALFANPVQASFDRTILEMQLPPVLID
jgi:hypothetical protein